MKTDPNHPLADDTIYVLKDGTRVHIHSKYNNWLKEDFYLVITIKDGHRNYIQRNDFKKERFCHFKI